MNQNPEIDNEAVSEKPKSGALGLLTGLLDYAEIIAASILAVLLIFTFAVRLCRVDGDSMNKTLLHTEMLLTTNAFYEPEQGDIIVFHSVDSQFSKPLVKRVIATEGQTVVIDLTDKKVFVDGVLLDEPYVYLDTGIYNPNGYFDRSKLTTDENGHTVFTDTVPEGMLFVMGDNRNHSSDSRSRAVGMVDEDCVIGKALLRLKPFTVFD
ncbi:MAG: signal peptidase I [Clostridia bacterium]|nr:signal peptidase I [Clostridia bacterium]